MESSRAPVVPGVLPDLDPHDEQLSRELAAIWEQVGPEQGFPNSPLKNPDPLPTHPYSEKNYQMEDEGEQIAMPQPLLFRMGVSEAGTVWREFVKLELASCQR